MLQKLDSVARLNPNNNYEITHFYRELSQDQSVKKYFKKNYFNKDNDGNPVKKPSLQPGIAVNKAF